jgi:hypothetical protein
LLLIPFAIVREICRKNPKTGSSDTTHEKANLRLCNLSSVLIGNKPGENKAEKKILMTRIPSFLERNLKFSTAQSD